jgi:putative selenate reductase molybdopterin-binding subunit
MNINFTLNGTPKKVLCEAGENVQELLKRLHINSVRDSDNHQGFCGSDTIILNGRPVNAGLLLAPQIDGKDIKTVESLSDGKNMSAIQSAMVDAGIVQSGYNSPAAALLMTDLLERIANPTREDVQDAFSGLFNRATGYEQFFKAVEIAVERLKDPEYTTRVAPDFRDDLRLVGKAKRKIDSPKLVMGKKAFVEDFVDSDACVLKILRSPYAHAYIKSIDTKEAEKIAGVVAVITHKNCPDRYYGQAGQGFPEPSPYDRKLFGEKVRHVGDRVAAVVAEDLDIAEQALKAIKVEYEVLEPVLTIEDAMDDSKPRVQNGEISYIVGAPDDLDNSNVDPREGKIIYQFPIGGNPRKNIAASVSGGIGDIEKGFEEAEVILEREYSSTQIQCTPLEPHVAYAKMDGDRVVLHASTQVPWHLRRIVAETCGIPENKVHVIKERVGGGYGSKQDILLEEVTAYATYLTGRGVYFRHTREEEFVSCSTRKPMTVKVKLGAKKDGTFTAVYMDLKASVGPYGAHCLTVPMNACSKSLPLFLCDNIKFDVNTYYTTVPTTGAYQGYGAPKGSYALQTAVAELADELGMDQMDLVRKNMVKEGVMLEILRCLGEGREGTPAPVESCGLEPALEEGEKMIDWGKEENSDNPDIKIGKGFAIIQQGSGLPGLDHSGADIKMLNDGTFMLHSGGADLGTGLDTLTVKVAAEILCVDIKDVSVLSGDTDNTPFDTGAYASSGTFFSGNAAKKAAEDLREKILAEAALQMDEPVSDLEIVYPATVKGKKSSLSYAEISHASQGGLGRGQLIGFASYTTEHHSFPYGAHFAQVAVNTKTGEVKVQKYYALQDCGTPINPELAMGQIYGGVLKSIGHSLYEEMIFDENGVCQNPNLKDYGVPMIKDIPEDFEAKLVFTDDPHGPFGGKSVSEIATNGASPALAIAIHNAVGVWIRKWPFSPEAVLKALGKI